jgi:DNA-binding response OmpR family regulator
VEDPLRTAPTPRPTGDRKSPAEQRWGPGHENNTNYLRVYFTGLRRKLEPHPARPRHLITEPGMGYRYQP